jgi:hypothetical protein
VCLVPDFLEILVVAGVKTLALQDGKKLIIVAVLESGSGSSKLWFDVTLLPVQSKL